MTLTKAKYIGILYTFLFTLLQVLAVSSFMAWVLDLHWSNQGMRSLFTFFDKGIPIVLIFSFIQGKRIGPHIIMQHHKPQKGFSILHRVSTTSMTVAFLILFCVATYQSHGFELDRYGQGFSYTVGVLIFSYLINIIPSIFTGVALEWVLEKYKPKTRP